MVQYYAIENGRVVKAKETGASILCYIQPTEAERTKLVEVDQIDDHNLASALDRNELPRVEFDTNHLVCIFRSPQHYAAEDNFLFRINSIGLFLFKDKLIIIMQDDGRFFEGRAFNKELLPDLASVFLRILATCVSHFFTHLEVINDIASQLEPKLAGSLENKSLMQMFSIEKSLVYYVNAISANGRAIMRLKTNARNPAIGGLSAEVMEDIDDLAIDNAQCLDQAKVYAGVFTGLMDARESIVNNNMSTLMKHLTVINVVFLPLNLLAGIGGMSEYTAFMDGIPMAIAYGCLFVSIIVIGFLTYSILRRLERRSMDFK